MGWILQPARGKAGGGWEVAVGGGGSVRDRCCLAARAGVNGVGRIFFFKPSLAAGAEGPDT